MIIQNTNSRSRGYRVNRCYKCKLPQDSCICHYRPQLKILNPFYILTHPKELKKPTNTGRIAEQCLSEVKIVMWDRLNFPTIIKEHIQNKNYQTYLVMPDDYSDTESQVVSIEEIDKKTASFILLDGTWKQAKRMLKKSSNLKKLPVISLSPKKVIGYSLRKSDVEYRMSTLETIINLLQILDYKQKAYILNNYFTVFKYFYLTQLKNKNCLEPKEAIKNLENFNSI